MTKDELVEAMLEVEPAIRPVWEEGTIGLPMCLVTVASHAFVNEVPESIHTQRVREALKQLQSPGFFSFDDGPVIITKPSKLL